MLQPPSEYRLHPVALILFLARQAKEAIFAIVALFIGSGGDLFASALGASVSVLLLVLLVVAPAVVRLLTFRYRYDPGELVIRWGWLARKERHIPFTRIQSIDASERLLHRLTGTVEVAIETGGGAEAEGKIAAIPRGDFEVMRERVLRERAETAAAEGATRAEGDEPPSAHRRLASLGLKDLLLTGLILNKGMVLVFALGALIYEWGLSDRLLLRFVGPEAAERGTFRTVVAMLRGATELTPRGLVMGVLLLLGFLAGVRLLSMLFTIVRYHDHRLELVGADLRVTCGLLTRSTSTTPLRRIQSITIREGPWHRLAGRVTVQAATAGGSAFEEAVPSREVLAPLLPRNELPALLSIALGGTQMPRSGWTPAAPPSTRRAMVRVAVLWAVVGGFAWWLGAPALVIALVLACWSVVVARARVRHFRWLAFDEGVALCTGWLWRRTTIVRDDRIQLAMLTESPWDRRHGMAKVSVDTAGSAAPMLDFTWLTRHDAVGLVARLDAAIAATEFTL